MIKSTVSPHGDVMYKKYKRLVYKPPDLLAKIRPDLFPKNLFSRPNLL